MPEKTFDKNYYQDLEIQLVSLSSLLETILPTEVRKEFQEFIKHGEYGLAFEVILFDLQTKKPAISKEIYRAVERLGMQMGYTPIEWTPLQDRIVPDRHS